LAHPVLGTRYRECAEVVHSHLCKGGVSPLGLMGSEIDVLKLRSSLRLFLKVTPDDGQRYRNFAEEVIAKS
jgi:uncharacterized protein (DUF1810 family)